MDSNRPSPTPAALRPSRREVLAGLAALGVAVPASSWSTPAAAGTRAAGHGRGSYVSTEPVTGGMTLFADGRARPLWVDDADLPGVVRVAGDLRDDIERVSGRQPALTVGGRPAGTEVVVLGTLGHSPVIDDLVARGLVDTGGVAGRWETSLQQVVENPWPGTERAFVLAGSDQRGAIFAAYDLSRRIGVSPWYFWDDITPERVDALYLRPGRYSQGTPAVKYRGIFVNDENPSLGRWAPRFFGAGKAPGFPNGFNAAFYAVVFETILRLKGNYLWPAVWGRAFAEDDPQNQATATRYGVVMGTSHEAPMMRGIEEWNRHAVPAVRDAAGDVTKPGSDPYGGTGEWSFVRNADAVEKYWSAGVERMRSEHAEAVVTLGMRGNGDTSLPDGAGIDLMREIIATQRDLIAKTFGSATAVPQVWTLYKEVQRYWDEGLRVPDDVTVIFTDDNWGNLRKLPDPDEPERSGGYGLYYHFDYVGGGRNYKWVDTASIPNVWEQLHTSYAYGIRNLWVVNVGDLKGNEEPTQFFLDYAWDPDAIPLAGIEDWERRYAAENVPDDLAGDVAAVLRRYGFLQSRRKPELLNRRITLDPAKDLAQDSSAVVYDDQASPFSLTSYDELDRVTAEWQALVAALDGIEPRLPRALRDGFTELVGYEVRATANLYALRRAEFTNLLYAAQGRAAANRLADRAERLFDVDQELSRQYNEELAGGKWDGFQTQPHIDYGDVDRYGPNAPWQQPEVDNEALPDVLFPAVRRLDLPARAELGVAVDGSDQVWPRSAEDAVLPTFSPWQSQPTRYLDVFARGSLPVDFQVRPGAPWVRASSTSGRTSDQVRVELTVDWRRAPHRVSRVPIVVSSRTGTRVVVQAVVDNRRRRPRRGDFVESDGYVSFEADDTSRRVRGSGTGWRRIPRIGRTGDGMQAVPVTAPARLPGPQSARLVYGVDLLSTGPVTLWVHQLPRLAATGALRYAISVDDETPQVVDAVAATGSNDTTMNKQWERNTSDAVNRTATRHTIDRPGHHTVTIWLVDPTAVFSHVVLDTGGLRPSYLPPPESRRAGTTRR